MDNKVLELRLNPRPPIRDDNKIDFIGQGIILQNTGTVDATIDGLWTLKPGSTFQVGVTNDSSSIFLLKGVLKFTGSGTKEIQVMEVLADRKEFSNYSKQ